MADCGGGRSAPLPDHIPLHGSDQRDLGRRARRTGGVGGPAAQWLGGADSLAGRSASGLGRSSRRHFFEIQRLAFGAVFASMAAYLTAQFVDVRMFHFEAIQPWTGAVAAQQRLDPRQSTGGHQCRCADQSLRRRRTSCEARRAGGAAAACFHCQRLFVQSGRGPGRHPALHLDHPGLTPMAEHPQHRQ